MAELSPQTSPEGPADGGEINDFVSLTQHRLALYRQHRANVDMVFDQIAENVDELRGNGFPINFERVNSDTAALHNDAGEKVIEMTIDRMQPIMLYPAKVMAEQQAAMQQRQAQHPMQRLMAQGAGSMGTSPMRRIHPAFDDDEMVGSAGKDAPRAEITASEGNGPEAEEGMSRPMTLQELLEGSAANDGPDGGPDGKALVAAQQPQMQFDGTRGLPESPIPEESLVIKVSSNIEGQPDEIQIVYDMANPLRNMSFSAHLADVAAFVKDQAERPAAERDVDGTPFKPEPVGLGFKP